MDNADLLSLLGGAAAPSRGGATTSGTTETSILHFKAGKMTPTLQPNGKYLVEPDARRGELHVVWTAAPSAAAAAGGGAANASATASGANNSGNNGNAAAPNGHLQLEWRDRRTQTAVNTIRIFAEYDATFQRVETGREGDRVYLLTCGAGADARHFFWMQDRDAKPDDDLCAKVNLYMADPAEASQAAGTAAAASGDGTADGAAATGGMDNAELLRLMQGALGPDEGGRLATVPGNDAIPTAAPGQVDALGNILENLGVPRPSGGVPAGERTADSAGEEAAAAAGGTAAGGGLTLADLQGAMAGLATAPGGGGGGDANVGPPLAELAANDIVDESGILDDPETVARLVALLPEGQRTEARLRENIRSPQVAQTLQRLTAALADDAGGFNSILANFQLDPNDGAAALAAGNPVGAFLECLWKDVERKEGVRAMETEEAKEEGGDAKEGGEEGKDGEDGKMDES
ncbi:hypothetical protein ACHAXT_003762 [Thalassiosira profunda]